MDRQCSRIVTNDAPSSLHRFQPIAPHRQSNSFLRHRLFFGIFIPPLDDSHHPRSRLSSAVGRKEFSVYSEDNTTYFNFDYRNVIRERELYQAQYLVSKKSVHQDFSFSFARLSSFSNNGPPRENLAVFERKKTRTSLVKTVGGIFARYSHSGQKAGFLKFAGNPTVWNSECQDYIQVSWANILLGNSAVRACPEPGNAGAVEWHETPKHARPSSPRPLRKISFYVWPGLSVKKYRLPIRKGISGSQPRRGLTPRRQVIRDWVTSGAYSCTRFSTSQGSLRKKRFFFHFESIKISNRNLRSVK